MVSLSRSAKTTSLANGQMKIIAFHPRGEKLQALVEATHERALVSELIDYFKQEIPGDELLRSYLVRKRAAQAAIPSVIAVYRETLELGTGEINSVLVAKTKVATATKSNDDIGRFVDSMF